MVRTEQRHAAIQQLRAAGYSLSGISRELKLARNTVRRFLRAHGLDELVAKTTSRSTLLDGFEPYLHQRRTEGCTNAAELFAEIRTPATVAASSRCAAIYVPTAPLSPRLRRLQPSSRSVGSSAGSCASRAS